MRRLILKKYKEYGKSLWNPQFELFRIIVNGIRLRNRDVLCRAFFCVLDQIARAAGEASVSQLERKKQRRLLESDAVFDYSYLRNKTRL